MSTSTRISEEQMKSHLQKALKKLNTNDENVVCRYLPVTGGYMHHFTFRKMKVNSPEKLVDMLNKYILDPSKPQPVPPKQRAPRGSRKKKDHLNFTRSDIDRILQMARMSGDREIIRKLTRKDLKSVRRELIQSIKQGRVESDLWNSYVESITNQQYLEAESNKVLVGAK